MGSVRPMAEAGDKAGNPQTVQASSSSSPAWQLPRLARARAAPSVAPCRQYQCLCPQHPVLSVEGTDLADAPAPEPAATTPKRHSTAVQGPSVLLQPGRLAHGYRGSSHFPALHTCFFISLMSCISWCTCQTTSWTTLRWAASSASSTASSSRCAITYTSSSRPVSGPIPLRTHQGRCSPADMQLICSAPFPAAVKRPTRLPPAPPNTHTHSSAHVRYLLVQSV